MKVFSFDVYDTCYTRFFAKPTDLFHQLAVEYFNKYGIDIDSTMVNHLAKLRIEAEKRSRIARRKLGYGETTLDAIYEYLYFPEDWQIQKTELKQIEIDLESKFILPIEYTTSLIEQIRSKHNYIVFISDMYLPEHIIKNNLNTLGIWRDGDKLYVSSETNKTKHSGELYSYVLKDLSIDASQLNHFGDNTHADFKIPKSMGINAKLFDSIHLQDREAKILKDDTSPSYLLRSQIASASRDTRLSLIHTEHYEVETSVFDNLASDLISPFLFAFVLWVINESKRIGYTDLYFVSRDGEILYKIARVISPLIKGPECHYMHGSRQAWNITDYISKRFDRLGWLKAAQNGLCLTRILSRLHLNVDDIKELKLPLNIKPSDTLSKKEIETVIEWFCSDDIYNYLLPKLEKHKIYFHQYMQQIGIFQSKKPAIVDIGWNLSGLRILNEELSKKVIGGLFFGSFKPNEIELNNIKCDYSAYFDSSSKNSKAILRYGPCILIESLFTMPSHHSLKRYNLSKDNKIVPEINGNDKSHDSALSHRHHKIVLKFINRAIHGGLHTLDPKKLMEIMFEQLILFIQSPVPHEAAYLGKFFANAEQVHNTDNTTPLVKPFDLANFWWLITKNKINPQKPYYWIEGSIAISPWYYKLALKNALFIKKLFKTS